MKYLSIDYRSWPSGLGSIIDEEEYSNNRDTPDGKHNMTLISYEGCGIPNNQYFRDTVYFECPGEFEDIFDDIIKLLKERGVTHVYDSERWFDGNGDWRKPKDGYFPLEDWIAISREKPS